MKKHKVELLRTALEDLENIQSYYLQKSGGGAAEKVTGGILGSLKRLASFPLSGAYPPDEDMKKNGFRMVVSGSYISVYRLVKKTVFIYHIFHGSRDYAGLFSGFISEKGIEG